MADDFEEDYGVQTEDAYQYLEASKESIIFLVDASQGMQRQAGLDLKGFSKEDTFLDLALKAIQELLKQHIIGSPRDQVSIIFYSSRNAKNSSDFPNIYIFHELMESTAQRIKEVEALQGGAFQKMIGSAKESSADDLRDGLWAASQALNSASTRSLQRVMIFTINDDPIGSQVASREQVLSRALQLREAKVEVQLFNLTPENQEFSMDFWKAVICNPEEELDDESISMDPMRLQDLALDVRRKSYKKRPLASLFWYIDRDFKMAVKMYALIQKAAPSNRVDLDLKTNEVLKSESAHICNDTGAVLEKIEKYIFPGKSNQNSKFPRIIVTAEQRKSMSAFLPPGIRLVGFKKLSCLKNHHQLRNSNFLYPDEKQRPGSATAFIALHDRLLHRDMFALCSIVRSHGAEPRLVALLPQQEEVDEYGAQMTPPGFNVVWLPYADDLRHPEKDSNFLGHPPYEVATPQQVAAATEVLKKLHLEGFEPGTVPNPHLQRHFQVVEALALGEEPPGFSVEDDLTRPDKEGMTKQAGKEISAFRDAVYGAGNDGVKAATKKRKAEENPEIPHNFKKLAEEGTLGTLTLPPLKEYCKKNKLSMNGRKDDIIERIKDHIMKEQ